MPIYQVNADFNINVITQVDTDDPKIPDTDEAIRDQAKAQFFAHNFDLGDPVSDPKINWVEKED